MFKFFFIVLAFFTLGFTACNSKFTPKETGYPAIKLPKKVYLTDAVKGMPYTFNIPSYAVVDTKMASMGAEQSKTGWMNLQFPTLNATLYISYNAVQKDKLDVLVRDAYNFANNHSNKASFIEDSAFENPIGLKGVFFHLGGDVASPYQFFITDSSRHFLRAALYFDTTPNADSLTPVINFLYQDLKQLVQTFHWKS
jgi:gliding motility-associated lipoprotein GldD